MTARKQYPQAKKAWDERTDMKVVPVRLDAACRAKLDELAARYGGRRQAIETAIQQLHESQREFV